MAQASGLKAKEIIFVGGDTHCYINHIPQMLEQIKREPLPFPKIEIKKQLSSIENISTLEYTDFNLIDYRYLPPLKMKMAI